RARRDLRERRRARSPERFGPGRVQPVPDRRRRQHRRRRSARRRTVELRAEADRDHPRKGARVNYRRVLLIANLAADTRAALAAIRRVAPRADRLAVVAWLPAPTASWFSAAAPPE